MTIDELRAAIKGVEGKKEIVVLSAAEGTVFEMWAVSDCVHDNCVLFHATPPENPPPVPHSRLAHGEDDGKGRSLAA